MGSLFYWAFEALKLPVDSSDLWPRARLRIALDLTVTVEKSPLASVKRFSPFPAAKMQAELMEERVFFNCHSKV